MLTNTVNQGIPFFWTGPSTLASKITTKDIEKMSEVYQRPMIIWDNVPVNDYQKDSELLFLSPYENRTPSLANDKYQVLGVVSNPMSQWELSKITVGTLGDYLWCADKYEPETSLEHHLGLLYGEDYIKDLKIWCQFNPNRHTREPYPGEIKLKLKNREIAYIDQQMEDLQDTVNHLKTLEHDKFQQESKGWFKKVDLLLALWEGIKCGDSETMKEQYHHCLIHTQRLGRELPVEYYKLIFHQ